MQEEKNRQIDRPHLIFLTSWIAISDDTDWGTATKSSDRSSFWFQLVGCWRYMKLWAISLRRLTICRYNEPIRSISPSIFVPIHYFWLFVVLWPGNVTQFYWIVYNITVCRVVSCASYAYPPSKRLVVSSLLQVIDPFVNCIEPMFWPRFGLLWWYTVGLCGGCCNRIPQQR